MEVHEGYFIRFASDSGHPAQFPRSRTPSRIVYGIDRFNGPRKNATVRPNIGSSKDVADMGRQVAVVLYVVAMAAVIVGVDFVFFRNRFWERLTVNIGIVLVFAAFYFRFLRG